MLLTFFVCFGIYVYLILFPQVLYKNNISYRNFSIYSNDQIDENIHSIIDNCIVQLKTSEIYDSTVAQKVFFIQNSFYMTLTKTFSKERSGYHVFLINNTMIVPKVNTRQNTITYEDGRVRNLAQTIIHETVHSLQERKFGFWHVIKIPEWKLEGYAYYITKTPEIINNNHLNYKFIRHNLEDIVNHSTHKHYWVYGVLTAYLLNEKHCTVDQFFSESITQETAVKEVADWYFNNSNLGDEQITLF